MHERQPVTIQLQTPWLIQYMRMLLAFCRCATYGFFALNLVLAALVAISGRSDILILPVIFAALGVTMLIYTRFMSRIFTNPPTLTVSADGITIGGFAPLGCIAWEDILSVEKTTSLLTAAVRIVPRDYSRLRTRLGDGGANLWKYRILGGFGLPDVPTEVPGEDMVALLERYRSTPSDPVHQQVPL